VLMATNAANGITLILGNTDDDADIEFQLEVQDGSASAALWIGADFIL
jgi:hypothetical protein